MLQAAQVPIVEHSVCANRFKPSKRNITERMFCAGFIDGGVDSCQGDSGGPVQQNGKLVGIVSWGIGCAKAFYPGVYTDVPHLRDWVRARMVLDSSRLWAEMYDLAFDNTFIGYCNKFAWMVKYLSYVFNQDPVEIYFEFLFLILHQFQEFFPYRTGFR